MYSIWIEKQISLTKKDKKNINKVEVSLQQINHSLSIQIGCIIK